MGLFGVSFLLLLCSSLCVLCATSYQHDNSHARPHIKIAGGPTSLPAPGAAVKRAALQVLTPQQIMSAYSIPYSATAGTGKKIAIIDAYGCPTCESDLGTFSSQWSLPSCTTANGCFNMVSQTGTTSYPPQDSTGSWGLESAMDVQAAHAMAPGAKIYLITCASSSSNDLFAGVQYAVNTLGANVISMSWGGNESSSSFSRDSYFSSTSIGYFASTGDNGAAGGIQYPSSSTKVIAVGGTSLLTNSGTFSSEQAWSGGGGGCSAFATAIPAQSSHAGYSSLGCAGKKALPDTSFLADPKSGMYVYYSGLLNGKACTPPSCWYGGGGTSLSAPLLAGRAAARGILSAPSLVYSGGYSFRDVNTGSNGYAATSGEDLATGVGSLLG